MEKTGTFTLTADDLAAAARLYGWSGLKSPRIIVGWLLIWLVAVLCLARLVTEPGPLTPGAIVANAPLFIAATVLPFACVIILVMVAGPIGARRQYAQQRSLKGEMSVGWSEEGLHLDTEYGAFTMPWDHFKRWVEDERTFLLFESARLYRVIPKRVLSEAQQESLRHQLARIGV